MNVNNGHQIGKTYLCKISSISKNSFEVETTNKEKGIVFINEISDYFIHDINQIISLNEIVYLTLIKINPNGLLIFSFKENKTNFLRTPFEFEIQNEASSKEKFQNLYNFTNKEIKKWKK